MNDSMRSARSAVRAFVDAAFSKDWFYRLFLAFGTIDDEMIMYVNDEALIKKRADLGEEANLSVQSSLAPPQGATG